MNIEFLGLPGSGKTTIRTLLLAELRAKKLPCLTAEEAFYHCTKQHGDKLARTLLGLLPFKAGLKAADYFHGRSLFQTECQNAFLAEYGRSLEAYLGSPVFERMNLRDRQNVIGNYLAMGSLWAMLRNFRSDQKSLVLYEEGFIQKSLMFVDVNSPLDDILQRHTEQYFANIPLPDLAIYIKTSTETSYQRMCSRSDGLTNRLKHRDRDSIFAFLEASEKHLNGILPRLNSSGRCSIIEATNNGSLQELVSHLASTINKHFAS